MGDDDDSNNKGNTGAGRKRRSIKANLMSLVNSVAVITALMSTCHFIFVPSMQSQDPFKPKENHIQKLLKRTRGNNNNNNNDNNNNITASVATIVDETPEPSFDFGDDDNIEDDDDDDDNFEEIGSNETKSFWGSLRVRTLGRTKKSIPNNDIPTSSLRKSAKAPP
eukprot:CAMPEP_0116129842 /NCGR_PEP_ID=MMETSP0329-20121206/8140_1 /TAXON_ID=697910 /ORGANISM="Pseudo-nitzschia arenysensis, Strain B593" /LENGTH=165 /DNA_ID=CAMNT_0003624137 /DNA_START=129 /DNA_END=626 /DNA_ORIENTATION=+